MLSRQTLSQCGRAIHYRVFGPALLQTARAYTEDGKAGELEAAEAQFSRLPQPQADAQLGSSLKRCDNVAAAVAWQRSTIVTR